MFNTVRCVALNRFSRMILLSQVEPYSEMLLMVDATDLLDQLGVQYSTLLKGVI
jgi:hypothetical protein